MCHIYIFNVHTARNCEDIKQTMSLKRKLREVLAIDWHNFRNEIYAKGRLSLHLFLFGVC